MVPVKENRTRVGGDGEQVGSWPCQGSLYFCQPPCNLCCPPRSSNHYSAPQWRSLAGGHCAHVHSIWISSVAGLGSDLLPQWMYLCGKAWALGWEWPSGSHGSVGRPCSPASAAKARGLPHNLSPDSMCDPRKGQLHNLGSLLSLLLLVNLQSPNWWWLIRETRNPSARGGVYFEPSVQCTIWSPVAGMSSSSTLH